jgi:transposase IS66-like protein
VESYLSLFAGSERGADRAAVMAPPIMTAKMNDVDPHAWLVSVLRRIADTPQTQLAELLPWNWTCRSSPVFQLHVQDATRQDDRDGVRTISGPSPENRPYKSQSTRPSTVMRNIPSEMSSVERVRQTFRNCGA